MSKPATNKHIRSSTAFWAFPCTCLFFPLWCLLCLLLFFFFMLQVFFPPFPCCSLCARFFFLVVRLLLFPQRASVRLHLTGECVSRNSAHSDFVTSCFSFFFFSYTNFFFLAFVFFAVQQFFSLFLLSLLLHIKKKKKKNIKEGFNGHKLGVCARCLSAGFGDSGIIILLFCFRGYLNWPVRGLL